MRISAVIRAHLNDNIFFEMNGKENMEKTFA
jgi:hypothetical protein